jgi:hypothetical protein
VPLPNAFLQRFSGILAGRQAGWLTHPHSWRACWLAGSPTHTPGGQAGWLAHAPTLLAGMLAGWLTYPHSWRAGWLAGSRTHSTLALALARAIVVQADPPGPPPLLPSPPPTPPSSPLTFFAGVLLPRKHRDWGGGGSQLPLPTMLRRGLSFPVAFLDPGILIISCSFPLLAGVRYPGSTTRCGGRHRGRPGQRSGRPRQSRVVFPTDRMGIPRGLTGGPSGAGSRLPCPRRDVDQGLRSPHCKASPPGSGSRCPRIPNPRRA